jgi:hypothetical protein
MGLRNEWVKKIKPGWYANKTNAVFELMIPIKHIPVSIFTVLSLRSYRGTPFEGSKMLLTAEVTSPNKIHITGEHKLTASMPYPTSMKLPSVAQVNDTVRLKFELVSGSRFMIAGMALCSE